MVLTAFTGGLTDRFGPRTMLVVGYLCSAATSLAMATAGSLLILSWTSRRPPAGQPGRPGWH